MEQRASPGNVPWKVRNNCSVFHNRDCIAVRSIVRLALEQKLFINRGSPDCLVNVVPVDTAFFVERLLLHLDNMLFYLTHYTGELVIKKFSRSPPTAKIKIRELFTQYIESCNRKNFQSYGIDVDMYMYLCTCRHDNYFGQ